MLSVRGVHGVHGVYGVYSVWGVRVRKLKIVKTFRVHPRQQSGSPPMM